MSLFRNKDNQLLVAIRELKNKIAELQRDRVKDMNDYRELYSDLCRVKEDNRYLRDTISVQNLLIDALNKRIGSFTNE